MQSIRRRVSARLGLPDGYVHEISVCVFPQMVVSDPPYALSRILAALDIAPEPYSPWKRYDLCVCFEDQTRALIDVPGYVRSASRMWVCDEESGTWTNDQMGRFLNARCTDISKRKVAEVFEAVFGYPLDVDPRSYAGKMVRKSNQNAAHDGRVITGPISDADYERSRGEYVYNVHVNNIDGDAVRELRLPWFGHVAPMLYHNRRPLSIRFSYKNTVSVLEPITAHLSDREVELIGEFCRLFGLDYGELDCLRDYDSGRLYLIDVNKTPCGPPNGLSEEHWEEAVVTLAVEFARGYILDHGARALTSGDAG
jgi:hypothetical protein